MRRKLIEAEAEVSRIRFLVCEEGERIARLRILACEEGGRIMRLQILACEEGGRIMRLQILACEEEKRMMRLRILACGAGGRVKPGVERSGTPGIRRDTANRAREAGGSWLRAIDFVGARRDWCSSHRCRPLRGLG